MSKKVRISLVVVILLFIAGMALYPLLKNKLSEEKSGPPVSKSSDKRVLNTNAVIIKYNTLNNILRTTGILIPDEEVDLAFETSGKITNIYFREGTQVKKGELLAKVNDKPLQAELQKLEAQLPLAQDRLFRQKSLLERDAVSQESYESVNTELEKLRADIELVKSRIAQTELRAPFDGVLGLRHVSEGSYASPATIISRLTKIMPLKLEFFVNEVQANEVKAGTRLEFKMGNDLNTYYATVYAVESKLDESTLSLKARAIYPNQGGKLKPGHSASVEIKLHEIQNTIVVPSISTIAEMGRDIAYVYKNGKASRVVIKKGMRTASSVQVLDGLNIGDTVITTGVMQLRDGLPVSIESYVVNE